MTKTELDILSESVAGYSSIRQVHDGISSSGQLADEIALSREAFRKKYDMLLETNASATETASCEETRLLLIQNYAILKAFGLALEVQLFRKK